MFAARLKSSHHRHRHIFCLVWLLSSSLSVCPIQNNCLFVITQNNMTLQNWVKKCFLDFKLNEIYHCFHLTDSSCHTRTFISYILYLFDLFYNFLKCNLFRKFIHARQTMCFFVVFLKFINVFILSSCSILFSINSIAQSMLSLIIRMVHQT